MARMECRCGEILSTTSCPNDVELHVFSDEEYDRIIDLIMEPEGNFNDIPQPEYDVWKCRKCKRIYLFEHGKNKPVMVYTLEKSEI